MGEAHRNVKLVSVLGQKFCRDMRTVRWESRADPALQYADQLSLGRRRQLEV